MVTKPSWRAEDHTANCQSHNAKGYGDGFCDCELGKKRLQRQLEKLDALPGKRAIRRKAYQQSEDRRFKDAENLWPSPPPCQHEHLDMDGICHACGADCRGAH